MRENFIDFAVMEKAGYYTLSLPPQRGTAIKEFEK